MAADHRSVVQAYHEEMECMFDVVKQARRFVANPELGHAFLGLAIEDLDHHRRVAGERQGPGK